MKTNTKADTSKSTVLVICMGLVAVYLIFGWKWAIYASLGVGVLAIASPFLSRQIEWAWMKLALILGYIVPNILLSLVFFFFLFPISLFAKIFNKDTLMRSRKYKTYFVDVNKAMEKSSFEKTW